MDQCNTRSRSDLLRKLLCTKSNKGSVFVDWQARYTEIKNNTIVALKEVKTIEEIEGIMADAADQLAELENCRGRQQHTES